jgi:hypothetical protein
MAINFSNGQSLSQVGGRISAPGRIIQTVHTVTTSVMNTSSTSAVDWFTSGSITLTNASNCVLIEHHSDNRYAEVGDGSWNLYYMDIVHVGSGAQISYTGYVGDLTSTIRHVHRVGRHFPGSVGPHTYKVRGWSYAAANSGFNTGTDNDAVAYIRLTEIAV